MENTEAEKVAQQLGDIPQFPDELQQEIERLRSRKFVELEKVKTLHNRLEGKRRSRQCFRVVGPSRTGKTMSCNAYRLRHPPNQAVGKPPTVPVVYIQPPPECKARELFRSILEHLNHQMVNGTVGEIRSRTLRALQRCGVEMLIIDEANRLHHKTFADVRDIFDQLEISVVLVGTRRLDNVIERDEQVKNRFLPRFWFGKLSGNEFKQTVDIWEKKVLQLPVPSNLSSKSMLKILGETTGGYIGLLDMILRESAIRALEKGLSKIDKETLQEVAGEYR
jgi:hypothetical protein